VRGRGRRRKNKHSSGVTFTIIFDLFLVVDQLIILGQDEAKIFYLISSLVVDQLLIILGQGGKAKIFKTRPKEGEKQNQNHNRTNTRKKE
jgi:hypothetical protein